MISWLPLLTHGIECNCISQADCVRRMSKRTTQWLNLSEITTSHYITLQRLPLCQRTYGCFRHFYIDTLQISLVKWGRDPESLYFIAVYSLWKKVNMSGIRWAMGSGKTSESDWQTERQMEREGGGETKPCNANFLTFKLDHTVQHDEGVWKPIKN